MSSEDDPSSATDTQSSTAIYKTIDTTNCTVIAPKEVFKEDSSLTTNMYSSFIQSTIDSSNCTVIAAEADSTNNDIPDPETQKKRKRNFSDMQFTPKQLKLTPCCSADETVSPIDFMTRSADSVKAGLVEQEETPLIANKFNCTINAEKILNSTPIAPGHDKHSKVVRKAIFRNIELGKGTTEDILGFLEKQAEKVQGSENKAEVDNISRIDISIIGNDNKDLCDVKDKTIESCPDNQGRFKDVDATVAAATDIEVEDMTEDILGLEEDSDLDYEITEADKTLLASDDVTALFVGVEPTKNKKEEETIDATGDPVQNRQSGNVESIPEPEEDKVKTKDTITISIDVSFKTSEQKTKETTSISGHIKDTTNEVKEVIKKDAVIIKNTDTVENKVIDDVKKANYIVINDQAKKKPDTATEEKKANIVEKTDDSPALDLSVFDTSHCRLEDANDLMTEVRQRWESNGVPSQDTNLTIATTFRINNQNKGLEPAPGDLEGDKLCCLNLYENEVDSKYNNKNQKGNLQSMTQTMGRLRQQLNCLEQMKYVEMEKLNENFLWQQEEANNRLNFKMQRLTELQDQEYNQAIWRVPARQRFAKQQFLSRLNQEHAAQRARLQYGHQRACHALQQQFEAKFVDLEAHHADRTAPIHQLLEQLETSQQTNRETNLMLGPLVTVTLKKAPCKESRDFTSVKVCLPAAVAQAVSQEDVIMDHFYTY